VTGEQLRRDVAKRIDSWTSLNVASRDLMADELVTVILDVAAEVAQSYEPRCDSCPRGVAHAIRRLTV
jgi:hypothetical protein